MTWTTPDKGEIRDLAARNLLGKSYEGLTSEQTRTIDGMSRGQLRVEARDMTARRRFGRPFAELTPEQARVVQKTKSRDAPAIRTPGAHGALDTAADDSQPAGPLGLLGAFAYMALSVPILFPVVVVAGIPAFGFFGRCEVRRPGRLAEPGAKQRGVLVMNETQVISAVGYVAGVSAAAALVGYLMGGISIALVLVLIAVPVGMFRALGRDKGR